MSPLRRKNVVVRHCTRRHGKIRGKFINGTDLNHNRASIVVASTPGNDVRYFDLTSILRICRRPGPEYDRGLRCKKTSGRRIYDT